MAVERLTDYTRRIWTGLAADAPDPDMQAGDVIYYMDTSKCSIITGIPAPGSIDTADLPDIGGGGGSGIQELDILASGIYTLAADSSASSMVVPVSLSGVQVNGIFISYTDSESVANGSTLGAFKSYNLSEVFPTITSKTFWTSLEGMCFKDGNGNIRYTGRTSNWVTVLTTDNLNAPTRITLNRQGGGQSFRAGDYYWEIRGKTL